METALKDMVEAAGIETSSWSVLWESSPDRIYTLTVPGTEAIATWRTLRALVPQTGHWPVLLGGEQDLEMHREMLEDADEPIPAAIIRQGLEINPQTWLAQQAEEWDNEDEELTLDDYHGEWPDGDQAGHGYYTPHHCSSEGILSLYIGLIPVSHSWEVPGPLQWGGWNACPSPEVHVSMMKYWYDQYGAEIVVATHDVIEMQIARPPKTREAALQLATEQFFYCEDIVTQGTETLESLAATLLNGTTWFFWWD